MRIGGKKETNIRKKLESSSTDVSGIARVAKKQLLRIYSVTSKTGIHEMMVRKLKT